MTVSMRQTMTGLDVATHGTGLYELTERLRTFVRESGLDTGLLTCFCQHTSCSLLIQENADSDVCKDLHGFFRRLVPEGMDWISHTSEGPDDMPAHIKAALTQTSITIPIIDGTLALGTWQGFYLFEHRRSPHRRSIRLHAIGQD